VVTYVNKLPYQKLKKGENTPATIAIHITIVTVSFPESFSYTLRKSSVEFLHPTVLLFNDQKTDN
jgi:hypothetical protein